MAAKRKSEDDGLVSIDEKKDDAGRLMGQT
jgi:hypothetical protein